MKQFLCALALVTLVPPASGQHNMAPQAGPPPVRLRPGLGKLHHAVSTKNPDAQKYFDQGLTLNYAFHHEEAVRSFQKAADLDPNLAMAHWGIALALGPNINVPVDPDHEKMAYQEVRKALALAPSAPENERAYIVALSARYSDDPKADMNSLNQDYAAAMKDLVKRYPGDLDAATLYAESLMDLHPWQYWTPEGKPAADTPEILSTLKRVLKRDPNHIGANHYFIHAVEASPHPEDALASAKRLPGLAPSAGHLVHMPAHVYIRTGDYAAAALSNEKAIAMDRRFFANRPLEGVYPMYFLHNFDFLRAAAMMEGRYAEAKHAADELAARGLPMAKQMPTFEGLMAAPTLVLVRFRKWDEVLKAPEPEAGLPFTHAMWHYARGLAFASRKDEPRAKQEYEALLSEAQKFPADAMFGLNPAKDLLNIAHATLISAIWGNQKYSREAAIANLIMVISIQDHLNYDEPQDWYYPVRETLGGLLLRDKQYISAENAFREDLKRNPHNGRSLFGLWQSLKAQGKAADAKKARAEFDLAWKNADTPLRVEDL